MRILCLVALLSMVSPVIGQSGVFTGLTRLSCEALLCLSSGVRPSPCNPALSHYFGINKVTWPATVAARLQFLNSCPTGNPGLARVIANGAGHPACDLRQIRQRLNTLSRYIGIGHNEPLEPARYQYLIPAHCRDYFSHPLTSDFLLPTPHKDCSTPPEPHPFFGRVMHPGVVSDGRPLCRIRWS